MSRMGTVQVYTGNGKGKTTAALGLAIRAAGRGLSVFIGQFMKGMEYGEHKILREIPGIEFEMFGSDSCIRKEDVTEEHVFQTKVGLKCTEELIRTGEYDVVILDEINVAVWFGLVSVEEVLRVLDRRPEHVELILTGRYAPDAVIDRADLVTEMREIKHYYTEGVEARDGIER